jgi:hypothetical protein
MREYAKFFTTFWNGDTGKKIRDKGRDVQTVAAYLITAPSSSMYGLYYLPLPTLCHEVGISKQGALKALGRVSEVDFAYYDPVSEWVWVPEMAHHQIGGPLAANDNRVKGIQADMEQLKKSPFFNKFLERYKTDFHLEGISPSEAPPKGLRSQEKEIEKEIEKEEAGSTGSDAPPVPAAPVPEELAKIIPTLKRVCLDSPGTLFGVWKKAYPDVDIIREILKCEAWAESKKVTRTAKGWAKTLNTWLSKEQDRAVPKKASESARLPAPREVFRD